MIKAALKCYLRVPSNSCAIVLQALCWCSKPSGMESNKMRYEKPAQLLKTDTLIKTESNANFAKRKFIVGIPQHWKLNVARIKLLKSFSSFLPNQKWRIKICDIESSLWKIEEKVLLCYTQSWIIYQYIFI